MGLFSLSMWRCKFTFTLRQAVELSYAPRCVYNLWKCIYQGKDHLNIKLFIFAEMFSNCCLFVFFNFLFYIRVEMINNVVIVSGTKQRDSAIYIHVSILPQTPLPSRLPHNIKQSFLCYTVGPCWLTILNIALCICQSQSP